MCKVLLNNELNGIELIFENKPASDILTAIKGAGFRWHNVKKIWYAKQTAERIALANSLNDGAIVKAAKANKKELAPLWERCKVENIPHHEICTDTKKVAAETRKHIKELFPEVKFSCRIGSGGWAAANEVNFYFISSPYEKDSAPMEAIEKYVKAWLWSFNYDNSDSMTDYFDRGFYEHVGYNSYITTEPTEKDLAEINDFNMKNDAFIKEQEEKAHAEYIKHCEEMERQQKEYEERRKIREAQQTEIINHVKVVELEENKKYLIDAAMICGHGKECNVKEVEEEGTQKEDSAVIKKEIYFNNNELYNNFCDLLLYDFDFLNECGGTGTLDERVTDDNFRKLNQKQRDSVKWILWDCVAVYLNNELKLIIDPEGYSYARYTNIVINVINKQLLTDAESKESEEQREAFFMPLPVAEQKGNIFIGGKYTLISVDSWILSASMKYITITSVNIADYAQYKNCLYITYLEQGKRKENSAWIRNDKKTLLYNSFIDPVPQDLQHKQINNTMYEVLTAGAAVDDFMINTYKYYKNNGIEPVLNTLQF